MRSITLKSVALVVLTLAVSVSAFGQKRGRVKIYYGSQEVSGDSLNKLDLNSVGSIHVIDSILDDSNFRVMRLNLKNNASMDWATVNVGKNILNQRSTSSMTFSKRFTADKPIKGDFEFDIPKDAKSIRFGFTGRVTEGTLKVVLIKPDKSVFHEFNVTSLADVSWNGHIQEKDMATSVGKWKVQVSSDKAEGRYNLNIDPQ